VYGDEWQLDARILKWHGFATAFGVAAAISALAIPYFFAVRGVLPPRPE